MEKVKVDFTNCYGIRRLTHEFDFGKCSLISVYASNGAMKTSLAKVFTDVSNGEEPKDAVFTDRKTSYSITDESNT